jgi:hypothetical protein
MRLLIRMPLLAEALRVVASFIAALEAGGVGCVRTFKLHSPIHLSSDGVGEAARMAGSSVYFQKN